jgi:uncharacterized protein (TIGR02118 family)
MVKVTVLYGHPTDAAAFERHYAETHMPLVAKMTGFARIEKSTVVGSPDGGKPAFYRIFEFWFEDEETLRRSMDSPEGKAAVADLSNFATGGVTVLVSQVEDLP